MTKVTNGNVNGDYWAVTSWHDDDGNPAGGTFYATGVTGRFQNGPLGRGAGRQVPNGTFVETLLRIAKERLDFYQESKFNCRENALAITKIEEAIHWLNSRTARREEAGVEGTHDGS